MALSRGRRPFIEVSAPDHSGLFVHLLLLNNYQVPSYDPSESMR